MLCFSKGGALEEPLHASSPDACALRLGSDHDVDDEDIEAVTYCSR
jgi:hypothetical protein